MLHNYIHNAHVCGDNYTGILAYSAILRLASIIVWSRSTRYMGHVAKRGLHISNCK